MSDKLYVEWSDIVSHCQCIQHQVEQEQDEVTNIIGVSRGGLIPATILAQMLNVRNVYSVGVKSYAEDGGYDTRLKTPAVYQDISRTQKKNINNCDGVTLIVDDISDQGTTLKYIASKYKFMNNRCASLFVKPGTSFIPRYYSSSTDEWIVFPWELNN